MKTIIVGLLALSCGFGVAGYGANGPEWLDCRNVMLVHYYAGAKWAAFDKHVDGHLAFLKKQLEAGNVLYAGPFENEGGGVSIYRATDLAQVEEIVRQDPVVAQGVMTYSLHKWQMCKLRSAEQAPRTESESRPAAKPGD
jgi:uncharacterized protein YciI